MFLLDIIGKKGQKTFFLTGLDEHGQKVQQAAQENSVSPKQHCDGMVTRFTDLWEETTHFE